MKIDLLEELDAYIPEPEELAEFWDIDLQHLEFLYSRCELTPTEDILFSLLIRLGKSFNTQRRMGYE